MGTTVTGGLVVDRGALNAANKQLGDSAAELRDAAKHIPSPSWGSGMNGAEYEAGRGYLAHGQRISRGIDRITLWLKVWTTAVEDTSGAIGSAAVEIVTIDDTNARATKQAAAQIPGQ
ncbi:hypothetical protein [Nocardia sp. NPDC050718]|uniref:hypothetical protein n=1 Tax=Nocardia sp. NPDC050718 TaxID=3155788 RepID=UPI0033D352A5